MTSVSKLICTVASFSLLTACQPVNFEKIVADNFPISATDTAEAAVASESMSLDKLIDLAPSKVNVDAGFSMAISEAISKDPVVLAAKSEAVARRAAERVTASGKAFNFDATLLGGIEDVTDETAGIATILKASKLLYDGGQLDAKIAADALAAEAAEQAHLAVINERAYKLALAWVELERYRNLDELIQRRLGVLDPLLVQLERVATSGIGDVSQVAAAQRTVAAIRITQTDVAERLAQAEVNFENDFGRLPIKSRYDAKLISNAVPKKGLATLAKQAPALRAEFLKYKSAEAALASVNAKSRFSVAFETKAQKPFGGSGYASDESIGLVVRKQFYSGDQLEAQIDRAEDVAIAQAEKVKAAYRKGERTVKSARQLMSSMDQAIRLARKNSQITQDEIDYLRKQLVIGGSTLDSVLSAEARLYEAESKEIEFRTEKRKAELTILGTLGLLGKLLGANK